MDHVAHAAVLVNSPPERVWEEALTSRQPRPEIMFGAGTITG